jgi:hypothetical protein
LRGARSSDVAEHSPCASDPKLWYAPVDGFSPSRTLLIASTTSGGSSSSTRRPTTTMLISHEAAHRRADRFWTAAPPGTSGRRTDYRPPAAGSHSTLPVSSEYTAPTMRSLPVATRSESTGFAAPSCSTTRRNCRGRHCRGDRRARAPTDTPRDGSPPSDSAACPGACRLRAPRRQRRSACAPSRRPAARAGARPRIRGWPSPDFHKCSSLYETPAKHEGPGRHQPSGPLTKIVAAARETQRVRLHAYAEGPSEALWSDNNRPQPDGARRSTSQPPSLTAGAALQAAALSTIPLTVPA